MRTSAGLPRLALTRIRKGAAMNQQVQPNIITPVAALTPDAIMQLGFAFWGSKTLLSAIAWLAASRPVIGSLAWKNDFFPQREADMRMEAACFYNVRR